MSNFCFRKASRHLRCTVRTTSSGCEAQCPGMGAGRYSSWKWLYGWTHIYIKTMYDFRYFQALTFGLFEFEKRMQLIQTSRHWNKIHMAVSLSSVKHCLKYEYSKIISLRKGVVSPSCLQSAWPAQDNWIWVGGPVTLFQMPDSYIYFVENYQGVHTCFWWYIKVHFVYAPSQWETALQCNVISHWLSAHTKWSLIYDIPLGLVIL